METQKQIHCITRI